MAAAAAPVIEAEMLSPGFSEVEAESRALPKQEVRTSQHHLLPAQLVLAVRTEAWQNAPTARPQNLLFGALKDPDVRLRKPIPLELSTEDGEVVLVWAEVEEFGYGATMGAALDDFGHTLRELYHRLYEPGIKLSSDLERVKETLARYIERRSTQCK
jgi:hypothetical protein